MFLLRQFKLARAKNRNLCQYPGRQTSSSGSILPKRRRHSSQAAANGGNSKRIPDDGLTLSDFVGGRSTDQGAMTTFHSGDISDCTTPPLTFHLKTYGCQMNVNDSDIVRSLLLDASFQETSNEADASILLTNTCAIREGAEEKVWHRMRELRGKFDKRRPKGQRKKVVGVLGCMAERLKEDLFHDGLADLVVGPDAYRDLPLLLTELASNNTEVEKACSVQLSLEETYADITPVRKNPDDVSAFVSIQRGCANRCSFCIVPFTRGQERSRPFQSIVDEVRALHDEGVKEITLLGQNVNSYHDQSPDALAAMPDNAYKMSNDGFKSRIRRSGAGFFFSDLVEAVSEISPELRVRFTSPHPKDYPPELLTLMAERPNVCKSLHMPAQSGSTSVLKRMKRGYSRETYLELMENVHSIIPDVAVTSDFISGFCDETEEEHDDTISLLKQVRYDQAFMFAYSLREKTHAHRVMEDNVPEEVKQRRLREVIDTFREQVQQKNEERELGRLRLVLIEGASKRSKPGARSYSGRTDQNKRILFRGHDDGCVTLSELALDEALSGARAGFIQPVNRSNATHVNLKPGDYAIAEVTEVKGHGLRGRLLCRSSITAFEESGISKPDERSLRLASVVKEAFALSPEERSAHAFV